jgi:hypothetical protein
MASIFGGFQCPGNSAERPLHQFVFSLQPIVQVMPRLAARLNENLIGSATDMFLGGTIELHTPFLLLSCWVLREPAQHGSPFSVCQYKPDLKTTQLFCKLFFPPRSCRRSRLQTRHQRNTDRFEANSRQWYNRQLEPVRTGVVDETTELLSCGRFREPPHSLWRE